MQRRVKLLCNNIIYEDVHAFEYYCERDTKMKYNREP